MTNIRLFGWGSQVLSTLFFIASILLFSQGQVSAQLPWVEDFGVGCNQGDSLDNFAGSGGNGMWTITATGANDDTADYWYVSATESYAGFGNCGDGCLNNGSLVNRTLHIGVFADTGATYNTDSVANQRAESPIIDCTGESNIYISFDYMEEGDGNNDNGRVMFSDNGGGSWNVLDNLAKTPSGSCGAAGKWGAFGAFLPASANNNPAVKIAFEWTNDGNGVGTNSPSFAVDNINLASAITPVASFTVNDDSICQTQCVNYTDQSTPGIGPTLYSWNFTGGTPVASAAQNPTVCYNFPGSYNVTLTVTDSLTGLSDDTTITNFIDVIPCTMPTAVFDQDTTSTCQNTCITFTDFSLGSPDTWAWSFEGGNPVVSSSDSTVVVCYDTPGTYDVTLIVTNGLGSDTLYMQDLITILSCPQPVPNFVASSTKICPGDCIVFSDQSTAATSWVWEFPGATPSTSTDQNPVNICYDSAGFYDVRLTVGNTNPNAPDSLRVKVGYIQVDSCLPPTATFLPEDDTICIGSCVTFNSTSLRAEEWFWKFWGTDTLYDTFNIENPTVCYSDSGFFAVELLTRNEYGNAIAFFEKIIHVGTYPTMKAGEDQIITIGYETDYEFLENEVRITAEGTGNKYTWTPSEGLDCFDCQTTIAFPRETTRYYVTNTNEFKCSVTDSLVVFVDEEYFAGIPNAFSPNGDNFNDVLYVRGNGIDFLEFVIYDRFGRRVFESDNSLKGWDGSYEDGSGADPGVYTYYVKLVFANGTLEEMKGNVSLFR